MKRKYKIIWLTGPSGAGKTTLAKRLQKDWPCIRLDGNEMRDSISLGAGFSPKDRAEHNYKVAGLARELNRQTNIIVSVIAPLKDVRWTITKNYPCIQFVYIKRVVPEREGHFYEEPDNYLTLNHDKLSIEASCAELKRLTGIEEECIKSSVDNSNI